MNLGWFDVETPFGGGGNTNVTIEDKAGVPSPGKPGGVRSSRTKIVTVVIMTVIIVLPAAYGFAERMLEFIRTYASTDGGGFAIVPILNYTLVSAGFIFLLVWAVAHGMFRDIEKPKYTMLEQEDRLDEHERTQGAAKA